VAITPVLHARLRAVVEEGPPVRLAVVFGSAAGSRLHAESDVDVGIIPRDPDLPLGAELTLQASLERACGRRVDLVRLDRAPTLLRWEVARSGIPIFAEGPHTFARFAAEAASERADLMEVLGPAAERFRRRLAATAPPATSTTGAGE
jgi:predicted nucleotidyltransferase